MCAGCLEAEILFNVWSVRCRKEINSEIICWSSSAMRPNLSCAFSPKDQRSRLNLFQQKNEGDFSRMSLENVGGEAKNQVWASSSRRFLEAFNSSTSEPDTHGLLLCVGGKALWVCGQRNAAHISAIAAVEVMHSRVGACRALCTSLFCINKRMSYCCTNQAVFYWAGVCLRADRWSTPTPLPLIYTITSRDVCLAEAFPIPVWATPAHHRPGPSPQMFPMPTTGSWRQKRVRGIHLSVEDFIKITPALRPFIWHRRVHRKRRCAWKKNASPGTTDLHAWGIALKIERTLKILQWKRELLVMTMMASFLSNINIPAGSLFSPGAKPLFHFESSLWRLETFPWYFFPLLVYLLVSRWRANLSHQAQTALFPQNRGQNNCHGRGGWVCVRVSSTKRLPRDGYSVSRGRDTGFDICISQKCTTLECKRAKLIPQKIDFFHISALNETHLAYVRARWD